MGRRLVILAALVLLASPALAGDDDAASKQAASKKASAAAAAVRAKLPAPNPGISFAYHGDLMIQDLWAGEVRLNAKLARLGREYVWRITEHTFMDWTGGEIHERLMVHAGKDLAIRSGTYERTDKDSTVSLGFSRSKDGFAVERRVRKGETWGKTETLTMKSAPTAIGGLAGLMLFLRPTAKAKKGTRYELPFVPSSAFKSVEDATPTTVTLEDRGPSAWERGEKSFETSLIRFTPGGTTWDMHLSRDRKKIVSMVSTTGPVQIVPAGMGGDRIKADPRAPASTWKQAFLKFGFGYHMAKKELLAEAFHWPLMYKHEVETLKRWSASRPLEEFKAAWIQEFVNGSKHRDVPATRRLLSMTFATGKVKKETDDEVVFWAHPNFGGGTQRTYYFKKVDERWGLWRIDFKQ